MDDHGAARALEDLTWVEILAAYRADTLRNGRGHYKAADLAHLKHRVLGSVAAIAAVAAGSTILAAPDAGMALTLTAGLVTLTAGALSALQTFGQYAQLADAHRSAGQAYAKVRTDCELLAAEYGEKHDAALLASELRSLKAKIDAVGAAAPLVPPGAERRALAEIAAGRGALPPALESHDRPKQ